jgi:NADPH:quinone reductase
MKAVVLDTDDQFRLTEIAEPTPGQGEVAIRVAYAGVQWGDVLIRDGHFPTPRPFVPGFEASGQIIAVGEGVDPARVGEQVIALTSSGGFAEVVVVSSVLAIAAPTVDSRTAAAFGWVTSTAYDLINTVAGVRPGQSVLIHAAAGGVGTLAGQFARAAGARRVVGVVGNPGQVDYARQLGYDQALSREEFPQALDGEHFDVILDPIGGQTRLANLEHLAPHGRIVVYGNIATFEPVSVSANDLLMQGHSFITQGPGPPGCSQKTFDQVRGRVNSNPYLLTIRSEGRAPRQPPATLVMRWTRPVVPDCVRRRCCTAPPLRGTSSMRSHWILSLIRHIN